MFDSVKGVLTKDIEVEKLKNILESEVRLKEFLLHEVEVKNLFSKNKQDVDEQIDKQVNAALSKKVINDLLKDYDKDLIESLKKDHQELLFVYDQIIKNAKAKKFKLVNVHLETFKKLLTQHYHKADEKLYCYLESFIRHKYPKRQKAFNSLNEEMKKISVSIFYSLSETVEIELGNDTYYCFMCSFTRLGRQLHKRIHREVTLLHNMYEECQTVRSATNGSVTNGSVDPGR